MRFSWFIAKRLLRSGKESGQLSTPVVRIGIGAIAVGLCVMIISVAIVTGFQQEIRAKVIGFGAHIQLNKYDSNNSFEAEPISREQDFLPEVLAHPEVRHVQTFATKAGIIKSGSAIEGVLFKGMDQQYDRSFLQKHLSAGHLPVFPDSGRSIEIVISRSQANLLRLDVDSSLIMYFVQDPPKARKFRIAGIYDTGLGENDFDRLYVWGDLRVVQQLNKWDSTQVSGFEILLKDFNRLDETEQWVYSVIPNDLNSQSIKQRYPQIFAWLKPMDTNVYIIITLMLVVSIINMITCLLIMILERTGMIGILKSMGAINRAISGIFLRQAAVMIGYGMLIGNALGIGLCYLQESTGLLKLNQETYYLSEVPVNLEGWHLLGLNAGTFGICLAAMWLPTLIISRISPARVMRFD